MAVFKACRTTLFLEQHWVTINRKPENVVHIFSFLALLLFRMKSSMARNRNFHVLQICMRTQVRLVNLISIWKGEGRGGGIDRNAIRDRF